MVFRKYDVTLMISLELSLRVATLGGIVVGRAVQCGIISQ